MYDTKRGGIIHKASNTLHLSKRSLYRHLKNDITLDTIRQEIAKVGGNKLLTFKEVALILNCSCSSVYRWATEEGKIPYYAIFGTTLRIKAKDLDKIIEAAYVAIDGTD